MNDKDVIRYLYLVDRKLSILSSGINWKPEYQIELESIEKELGNLRTLADKEHARRAQMAGKLIAE